jgi:hypothetical protein
MCSALQLLAERTRDERSKAHPDVIAAANVGTEAAHA